jgi:hypothetical protein
MKNLSGERGAARKGFHSAIPDSGLDSNAGQLNRFAFNCFNQEKTAFEGANIPY